MPAGNSEYRPDIDGLRAIAVLAVVLYHFGWPGLDGGFLGVDIFFVISGYLITRLIAKEVVETGRFDFGRFYLRRARRLFPALAATLAASWVVAIVVLSPTHLENFGWEMGAATLSISNFYFHEQAGYFEIDALYTPLLHTWSLGVEEQFYLIWPPLVWMASRWRPAVGLALLALGAMASLIAAELVTNRDQVFYFPWFRVFEFAAGAFLVRLDDVPLPGRRVQVALLGAGLLAMLLPIHFYNAEMWLPGLLTLVPVAGAALTIYAGRAPGLGLVLSNPASVWIGRISYSLYLVHWPIAVFHHHLARSQAPGPSEQILLPVVAIVAAAAMYRYVEMPFRTARIGPRTPQFVGGVLASAVALMSCGAALNLANGIPQRLDPDTAKLVLSAERVTPLRACHYQTEHIDETFLKTFQECLVTHGRPVVVFGDSHAGNLFKALAATGERRHIVGVWQGGCRLSPRDDDCYWPKILPGFLKDHSREIAALIYSQRGMSLMSDEPYPKIDSQIIVEVADRLAKYAMAGIPVIWMGPQEEPNFDVGRAIAFMREPGSDNYLKDNLRQIFDLDNQIAAMATNSEAPFTYISKIESMGPLTAERFIIDGEYTYADKDHWAAKGEEVFGRELLAGSPLLRSIMIQ